MSIVFTTLATVDESGVVKPVFNLPDGYTSGYLKYLTSLRGKKIKITIEEMK